MADLSSSDLVQRVRDLLGDNPWQTTSSTTGTGTTVAVPDGTLWSFGAIGEWQTGTVGFEQFYVQSVSGNNLTVTRGVNGTTAESHANGDAVIRNPGFAGRQIQQAITQTLMELWPYVFKVGAISLTYSATTKWYDLNALTLGIVSVQQQKNVTPADVGVFNDKMYGYGKSYIVRRNLPTALVSSGNGMTFPAGVYDTSGTNAIKVSDIRQITGTTDIVDSSNLPVAEAVTFGAIARILKATEIKRTLYGDALSTEGTVSVGQRLQLGAFYDGEFRKRLVTLQIRLKQLYDPDVLWSY
jgi:hypothetical protein